ncbi:MAG: prepilin-type N-terminal cleavage/methylation domain-containing protein [Candidatus Gastranaerophilaceae bacterium]
MEYHVKRYAFTLAEVLITLGIIGIVAAMTMPSLIQNHQVKSTVSRLKKVNSVLNQAYLFIRQNDGEFQDWYTGDAPNFLFYKYEYNIQGLEKFAKYMKPVKLCTSGTSCNPSGTKYLSGNKCHDLDSNYPSMELPDGTIIYYANYFSDCGTSVGQLHERLCGYIYVDINGKTKPNTIGKDVFCFHMAKNYIVPCGIEGDPQKPFSPADDIYSGNDACTLTNGGGGCTAWVLHNENMDYLKCADKLSWDGNKTCNEESSDN